MLVTNIYSAHLLSERLTFVCKGKGKVIPLQTRPSVAQRVGRGIALLFHEHGTRRKWSAARPCRSSPPGKTRYPFYRRLGGLQGRSRGRKISYPLGFDRGPSSPYSVAIPTELPGPQHPSAGNANSFAYDAVFALLALLSGDEWPLKMCSSAGNSS